MRGPESKRMEEFCPHPRPHLPRRRGTLGSRIARGVVLSLGLWATWSAAEPVVYAIDPTHTFVNFEVRHFGTSTSRGRFDRKEGRIEIDRAAKTGKLDITVDMQSISTGLEAFDTKLKESFFDAQTYPQAKFVADQFTFDEQQNITEVTGALTLKDRTQPVTLKAQRFNCYLNLLFLRQVCGGDFEAVIERSQWGIDWGLLLGVPDSVRLLIQVEAIKQ